MLITTIIRLNWFRSLTPLKREWIVWLFRMTRGSSYVLALVVALLIAGCTSGVSTSPAEPTASPAGTTDPTTNAAMTDEGTNTGTVDFYISDEENAIGDFAHVNATVTTIGFHRGGEAGDWFEFDEENFTADLTELQGAKSAHVGSYDLPSGEYTKVFIYVDEINATLENGEEVRVKLPSEKLQLNSRFTLENGSEVEFVFDITVTEAGNSGKYILQPVIAESGTDVPIESMEKDDDGGEEDEDSADSDNTLEATVEGNVTVGENVMLVVTRNDTALENASVTVNGDSVGTTNADGELQITIPEADAVTVVVESDGEALELEYEIEGQVAS